MIFREIFKELHRDNLIKIRCLEQVSAYFQISITGRWKFN